MNKRILKSVSMARRLRLQYARKASHGKL